MTCERSGEGGHTDLAVDAATAAAAPVAAADTAAAVAAVDGAAVAVGCADGLPAAADGAAVRVLGVFGGLARDPAGAD